MSIECGICESDLRSGHAKSCPRHPDNKRASLLAQVSGARREIRALKKATPHIFPEWQALRHAEDAFERAKAQLEAARTAWRNLGKDPSNAS